VYDGLLIDSIQNKDKARMDFNLYLLANEFKKRNEEADSIGER
jgi:hypothetical protein